VRCPHVHVGDRALPAFRLLGATGFVAGVAVAGALAPHRGLSVGTVLAMALAAAVGFLVLAMGTKVVTGGESITFYHHAVLALAASALAAALTGAPVVAHLDLAALGLGTFVAFGRLGCLVVGCCHGRPWSRGVCYGPEHAAEGFPAYLVGVRLFPLAAVEAGGVALAVAAFAAVWLAGGAPGSVVTGLAVTYAFGRFALEFARGDADRRYAGGFSEAQWSSLAATAVVATLALSGVIPAAPILALAPVVLALAIGAVAVARRRRPVRHDRLTHPGHVRELAVAAQHAMQVYQTGARGSGATDLPVNQVPIGVTSTGVLLSAAPVDTEHGPAVHYAISHRAGALAPSAVDRIVTTLLRLRHADGMYLVLAGDHGVTHLVVCPHPVGVLGAEPRRILQDTSA
jgi:prolipoprotein diacylglyceryltransferase